jgi:hypothetical protein
VSTLQTEPTKHRGPDSVKRLLVKNAIGTDRRTFLRRSTAAAFALMAGAAVGVRPAFGDPACTQYCSGPNGSGYCGTSNCNGNQCTNQCGNVVGYCPSGGSCWGAGGGLYSCCDCACSAGTYIVYCFCCGNQ